MKNIQLEREIERDVARVRARRATAPSRPRAAAPASTKPSAPRSAEIERLVKKELEIHDAVRRELATRERAATTSGLEGADLAEYVRGGGIDRSRPTVPTKLEDGTFVVPGAVSPSAFRRGEIRLAEIKAPPGAPRLEGADLEEYVRAGGIDRRRPTAPTRASDGTFVVPTIRPSDFRGRGESR